MSPLERQELKNAVYDVMADLEDQVSHYAGSYTHLCFVGGAPTFTHAPLGRVLRRIA